MAIYRKGADVDALDASAGRIELLAQTCVDVRSNTQAAFAALRGAWGGADFHAFDQRWPAFDGQLNAVDLKLRSMAERLRTNVAAQRAASQGAGPSASTPGSALPVDLGPGSPGPLGPQGPQPSVPVVPAGSPSLPPGPAGVLLPSAVAAFEDVFGHPPTTAIDAETAKALDPTTTLTRYQGVDSIVTVGRIEPVPGAGLVKGSLFIPREEVYNIPVPDLGDNRGMKPDFAPDEGRVTYYVDYENGVVVMRQNPSVSAAGYPIPGTMPPVLSREEVKIDTPNVQVQQHADGTVSIDYDAKNPFAPPGAELVGATVNGHLFVTPNQFGPAQVDGIIGDYPAQEVYHESPSGQQTTLLQDDVENKSAFGPIVDLPDHHAVGDPNSVYWKFYDRRPISGDLYEHRAYPKTTLTEGGSPPSVYVVPKHPDAGHPDNGTVTL